MYPCNEFICPRVGRTFKKKKHLIHVGELNRTWPYIAVRSPLATDTGGHSLAHDPSAGIQK